MYNIKISSEKVDNIVSLLVNEIQIDIINASRVSGNKILNAIENSSGDFINALKSEVTSEVATLSAIGQFLITTATYIQSAANAFSSVDAEYNSSKIK